MPRLRLSLAIGLAVLVAGLRGAAGCSSFTSDGAVSPDAASPDAGTPVVGGGGGDAEADADADADAEAGHGDTAMPPCGTYPGMRAALLCTNFDEGDPLSLWNGGSSARGGTLNLIGTDSSSAPRSLDCVVDPQIDAGLSDDAGAEDPRPRATLQAGFNAANATHLIADLDIRQVSEPADPDVGVALLSLLFVASGPGRVVSLISQGRALGVGSFTPTVDGGSSLVFAQGVRLADVWVHVTLDADIAEGTVSLWLDGVQKLDRAAGLKVGPDFAFILGPSLDPDPAGLGSSVQVRYDNVALGTAP